MRHLIIILIATITFSSCKTKNDGFNISGHIEGIKDSILITLYDLDQQINLDSAFSINGYFELSGKVEYPTGCWIKCQDEYANIQVENVNMSFTSPIKDMHLNSLITGGTEQELQNELMKLQKPYDLIYYGAYDSLMNKKYPNDEVKQSLIKKFNESQKTLHDIYIDFGKRHSDSYMGLDIVYMNRKSIDKDTLQAIFEKLPISIKSSPTANALKVFLFEEVAEVGKPFIDFEVSSIDGKEFKLSSLKGNYIYLCFWSAGCGPCLMEIKFLSEHYNEVPEDLSIVSFSIDKNIDAWKKASEMNNITWHNVSDKEGDKGKIKTQYQVQAIPTSFLIDKEGIIIKRFTGFDTDGNIIAQLKGIIAEKK
ncbi:MAG: AhpC/TSA family protein [Fermentimonas sp.]|nr:AhpC/TSA family protein [Fermentimonas sp.]